LFLTKVNILIDPLSRVALASFGWLVTSGFLLIALSVAAIAGALHFGSKRHPSISISTRLLSSVAAGFVLLSVFRIDPVSSMHTITGMVHIGVSAATCALFPLCCFIVAYGLAKNRSNKTITRYTLLVGAIGTLALLMRTVPPWSSLFGLQELIGGMNALVWVVVMSLRLPGHSLGRTLPA